MRGLAIGVCVVLVVVCGAVGLVATMDLSPPQHKVERNVTDAALPR